MQKKLKICVIIIFLGVLFLLSCRKEVSCEGCNGKNQPPVAAAGNDQIITLPTDSVSLDGSASSDPDGSISKWLWKKISGPPSFNFIHATSSITVVKALSTGTYMFELNVTDNGGLTDRDTISVIVDSVLISNHPPVANAGNDTTITLPSNTINLDGSRSSDPENNITNYAWNKISGPNSFTIANASNVQTQIASLVQGAYQFELKVTDAGGLFSKDTILITVFNSSATNLKPVSVPGNDTLIQTSQSSCTPVQLTITLNGSQSYDPDGSIAFYHWTGPGNVTITNPDSAVATVTGSFIGLITFSLKVTDNNGVSDFKTINYTILTGNHPIVNSTKTLIGNLSKARTGIASASVGNKILFAGGATNSAYTTNAESRVDIYDITTNTWSIAELSVPRYGITAIAAGNKIFFAGGTSGTIGDLDLYSHSTVDIYDVTTNTWSVAQLSEARTGMAAAVVGSKVFFAGGEKQVPAFVYGNCSDKIDIYDLSTNTWSVFIMSTPLVGISAVTANDKIYFAGGVQSLTPVFTDRIDIYDNNTNSWSVSNLTEPKVTSGIFFNDKIYWAGGYYSPNEICKVEIRNVNTGSTSIDYLSYPHAGHLLRKNSKLALLDGYGPFDIFDTNTNSWSVSAPPLKRSGAAVISVNNIIYVAGGWAYETNDITDEVYILNF